MTGHHFVSTWQVQAPIERVWEELSRAERWPSLVEQVARVEELEPSVADDVGTRLRLLPVS